MKSRYRLGCDIGGTFTDFVLLDETTGECAFEKVLTTAADPSAAVDQGLGKLSARHPEFVGATEHVIHGTTLVINAVIERRGARTALITTHGFRDVLAMRREIRYDIYDLAAVYPTPFVERHLCRGARVYRWPLPAPARRGRGGRRDRQAGPRRHRVRRGMPA